MQTKIILKFLVNKIYVDIKLQPFGIKLYAQLKAVF